MDTHYLCHVRPIFILLFIACVFSSEAAPYELFEQNGKMGIKDDRGQVVIPPAFEALGWSDGSFSVIGETTGYRAQNHWGLINLKKQFITPAEFEELVYQGGEFVVARKIVSPVATKSGCINLRGEIQLPFVYDGIKVNGLRAIVFNLMGSRKVAEEIIEQLKKKEKIACTAFLYFVFFYLIVIPPGDYSHVSIPYGLLFLTPISYSCDRRCRFSVTLQSINNHVFEL